MSSDASWADAAAKPSDASGADADDAAAGWFWALLLPTKRGRKREKLLNLSWACDWSPASLVLTIPIAFSNASAKWMQLRVATSYRRSFQASRTAATLLPKQSYSCQDSIVLSLIVSNFSCVIVDKLRPFWPNSIRTQLWPCWPNKLSFPLMSTKAAWSGSSQRGTFNPISSFTRWTFSKASPRIVFTWSGVTRAWWRFSAQESQETEFKNYEQLANAGKTLNFKHAYSKRVMTSVYNSPMYFHAKVR